MFALISYLVYRNMMIPETWESYCVVHYHYKLINDLIISICTVDTRKMAFIEKYM